MFIKPRDGQGTDSTGGFLNSCNPHTRLEYKDIAVWHVLVLFGDTMSKIGIHIVSGPRNGYGEFLRRCGDHLTVVKAVDEAGALWEARQFSDVLTVMAWESLRSGVNPQDDPVVQARAWWGRFLIKYNLLSTA